MKGAPGLVVAILLGLLGLALNFLYLRSKAAQVESLSFVGVREGVTIRVGDEFREEMFEEVRIPKSHAGNLVNYVYQYKDIPLIVRTRAAHDYREHELLSLNEARTPPPELKLSRGQLLMWVGVDSSSFVPDLLNPGDRVSFLLSAPRGPTPASVLDRDPAADGPSPSGGVAGGLSSGATVDGESKRLGPFVVAAIGSRIASQDLARANQLGSSGAGVIGIYAPYTGDEDNPILEPKAMQLLEMLRKHPNMRASVLLHPRGDRN
ncbi:MAG: hypothetical protein FJ295_13250 [Planctomycetes bacterium]|nr:hypothetical protein [Planctomycetota bacterium]